MAWELVGTLWPLVAAGAVFAALRVRDARRRSSLNRALHELRRPLQALALTPAVGFRRGAPARPDSLDLAFAALDDLDGAVNGAPAVARPRAVSGRALVSAAVERWRGPASRAGRSLKLEWRAGAAVVMADPARVAQALDNLIANAIEHGGLRVRVEAALCAAGMRIVVANDGPASGTGRPIPRRGHGLEVVRAVAAAQGGRFAIRSAGQATVAALELPLAPLPSPSTPIDRAAAPAPAAARAHRDRAAGAA